MPKTVDDALYFNKEDKIDIWQKAIKKEMKNVQVAFEFNKDNMMPVGHTEIRLHWVFDIKMDLLQWKARLVAYSNKTDPPKDMTYLLVVSRDSV